VSDIVVNVQQNATALAKDAEAAAKGMAKIAAQEERIAKLSAADRALGVGRDPKKLASALKVGDAILKAEQSASQKAAMSAIKADANAAKANKASFKQHLAAVAKAEKVEKDRLNKLRQGQMKAITDSKKFAENFGKLKSGNLVGLGASFGGAGIAAGFAAVAILAVAAAATVAAVAIVGTTAKITMMALEAKKARDESQGLVKIFAGGNPETVSKLSELLLKLGVDARVGEDQFVKLRKAGASIGESANAIKLVADVTAKLGNKAGAETLEQITNKVTALKSALEGVKDPKVRAEKIAEYNAALAKMAQQAGVVGDGMAAVESKATSAKGALFKLSTVKTQALEKIGDAVGPSLDRLSQKVAGLVEGFVNSEKGQKAIEQFGSAVSRVLDGVGAGIDFVVAHWDTISAAVKVLGMGIGVAMAPAIVIMAALGGAVAALGLAWAASTALIGGAAQVIGKVVSFVDSTIKSAISYLVGAIPGFYQAGTDIVQGIINGVTGAAGRLLSSVGNLASSAVGKFKSVLGIHSPSTVMFGAGEDTAEGAALGQESKIPRVEAAANKVAQATIEPYKMPAINARSLGSDMATAAPGAQALQPSAGGEASASGSPQLPPMVFNFHGVSGNPEELMRSARREFEAAMRNYFITMGAE
jgi:hypothetical protein